jgi:hypothetical protein
LVSPRCAPDSDTIFIDVFWRNYVRVMAARIVYNFAYSAKGASNMRLFHDDAQYAADYLE